MMFTSQARRVSVASLIGGFGAVMVIGLAIVVGVALYGIKTVGIGGQHYRMVIAGKDLVADILPPPEYLVEAYLQITLLRNGDGDRAAEIARLATLRKDFDDRRAYWQDRKSVV